MKTFLTPLLIVIAFSALSQTRMEPGYVVLNSGDTLRGEIASADWKVSPSFINFKKSGETTTTEYSSLQVRSFYLSSQQALFQSFRMTINQAPQDRTQTTASNYDLKAEKSFFATVLVRGLVSLYYMYDFKPHYIIKKQGSIQELIIQYIPTNVKTDAAILIGTNVERLATKRFKQYKKQLSALFHDCPRVEKKVAHTRFRTEQLKSIIIEYNNCKEATIDFVQKKEDKSIEVGVIAGMSVTTNAITNTIRPYLKNATYEPASAPTAGLFLNYVLPKNNGRYSLHSELSYVRFNFESTYREDGLYTVYSKNHSVFSYLQLSSGSRVRYNQRRLRPYFGLGLSGSYALSGEFYTTQERYLNGVFADASGKDFDRYNFSAGLWLDGGLAVSKRFDVQVKLHKIKGYSNGVNLMQYFLTLGYRLGNWSN
jgi:hypothetical protein